MLTKTYGNFSFAIIDFLVSLLKGNARFPGGIIILKSVGLGAQLCHQSFQVQTNIKFFDFVFDFQTNHHILRLESTIV